MYQQMFQGPLADHLAAGGGIGLRPMLERALRNDPNAAPQTREAGALTPMLPPGIAPVQPEAVVPLPSVPSPAQAAAMPGALSRIQSAAAELLDGGGQRWSRAGSLDASDLMPDITAVGGSAAHSSIQDARGYQGYYKCNLFALEVARRAGFAVPTVDAGTGQAYPLSNDITRDAADGRLNAGWARVVTGTPATALDNGLRSGERALMLTGSGRGERHGHMAVVERVRSVEYGPEGQVQRVVFDGWEARPDGARHLRERTWNLHGHQGGHDARDGFDRIEILELKSADPRPARSSRSASVTSSAANGDSGSSQRVARPIESSEEDSS